MADIKYVDLAEWQKLGGLQEANRLFFHTHGWALEATIVEESGDRKMRERIQKALAKHAGGSPYDPARDDPDYLAGSYSKIVEDILEALYPIGSVRLSGIWDYSDDPEGVVFGSWPEEYVAKAEAVHAKRLAHFKARSAMFRGDDGPWRAPRDPGEEDESDIEPFDYVWEDPTK